jgi:hypothetical protein
VATFDYRDENGALLFQVCRTAEKRFYQRRPNGGDRWVNNIKGKRRVPYRLPELVGGAGIVFIPEGEKHVDALIERGLRATCNSGGAGKWLDEFSAFLRDADVVILPDNDDAGKKHGQDVAQKLHGIAGRVRVLDLPNLAPKGDVLDWLAADGTVDELTRLTEATPDWKQEPRPDDGDEPSAKKSQSKNQAQILLGIAATADLFHTPDGTGYADLNVGGHRETWPVRSRTFRRWLAQQVYKTTGGAPSSEARQNAHNIIEAQAIFSASERKVSVRVASHEGKLYVDLADEAWRAVEIDTEGWRVVENPPVRFRRPAGMRPLPLPSRGGTLAGLRNLLNLSDADFTLAVAFMLVALRDSGPYPVLVLAGEQGSAKSTASAIIRKSIDPNTAPLRALPREERDLFIAANNSHVLAFDNVSGLPPWISDTLCRLSTGGGFATRELHTDQDEILFDAVRPIILNGIEDVVNRPDLADRAIMLSLSPISDEQRRTEKELWHEFDAMHSAVLGALLDGVAHGLRELPKTKLQSKPRMADFAQWAAACEGALDLPCKFEQAYSDNRAQATETVIEANPVADAVRSLMTKQNMWRGTATDLLEDLGYVAGPTIRYSRHWPRAAHILSGRLRRAATFLRKIGIDIDFGAREGHASNKIIRITSGGSEAAATAPEAPETSGVHDGLF